MRYYFAAAPVQANAYAFASAEEIQKAVDEIREFPHLYSKQELWFASIAEALKNAGTILLSWWCGKPHWAVIPRNDDIRKAADAATSEEHISDSLLAHGVPPVPILRDLALIRYYELHQPTAEVV